MTSKPMGPPIALRHVHRSPMVACLLFLALVPQGNAQTNCTRKLSTDCLGSNCTLVVSCENGFCSDEGECLCFPCFSGRTCSQYDDGFPPYFTSNEDLVTVDPDFNGAVYRAKAIDEDMDGVCLKQQNSPCICSKVWYAMYSESSQEGEEDNPFSIEEETGIVYMIPGKRPTPGHQYDLTIFASSVGVKDADKMVLHVDVVEAAIPTTFPEGSSEKTSEKVDIINYLDVAPGNLEEDEDPLLQYSRSFLESSGDEKNLTSNIRKKRDSAGANNELDKMTMKLNQIGGVTGDLFPGSEVLYQLKIVLPTLDTPTDLKVEIFVMDPVSGITPFVLCSVSDITIGSGITDGGGNTVSTTKITEYKVNDPMQINDKAIVDFGPLMNGDSFVDGSTDFDDSTITINFTAIFINNVDYKNSTAVITAGAEYNSGNHVWVAQDKHNFDSTELAVPLEGKITCPDNIGEGEAVSCTIEAFLAYTLEEVAVEVFTPNDIHDVFTFERMSLLVKGDNFYCRDEPIKYESYPSVTGRSNHVARASSYFLNAQSSTNTVAQRTADVGNWITFGFNIQALDAEEGDTISVGGGILVGTSKVWVQPFNLTVVSPLAAGADASFEVVEVSSSVALGGVASFGIKTTIPLGKKALVKCSADNSGDPKIGGVVYGSIGSNIGRLKDIGTVATLADDGTLSWDIGYVCNTGWDTTNAEANVFIMEVGVQYSTSIVAKSIECGSQSLELPVLSEFTATGAPSGQLTTLGKSTSWVAGSQAGVEAKIHFPPKGVPYELLNFEATGDVAITTYFPAVCRLRVMHAGRGVPSAAFTGIIDKQVQFELSRTESTFNDLGILDLGRTAGVQRANPDLEDYNIIVQAVFQLPEGQTGFSAGTYHLNTGVKLGASAVWTAGAALTTTTSFTQVTPRVKVLPDKTTVAEGESTRVRVIVKTDPGSVGKYKFSVQSSSPSNLKICRIKIAYIGDNYPCVTQEPFAIMPSPITTTIMEHDIDTWIEKAAIDFGTLQNLGTGEIYPTLIGDVDAIVISIFVSGAAAGGSSLSTTLGSLSTSTSFSITSPLPPAGTLTAALKKQNDSAEAYEGVMHISTLVLNVPEGYNREVKLKVSTDAAVTDMILCLVALAKVGENVPCTVPIHVVETRNEVGESPQWVQLDLGRVCHLKTHPLGEQDKLTIYIGTTFTSTGSSADISVTIWEDNVEIAAPTPLTLSKSTSAYVEEDHDISSIAIRAVDNSTTTVTRGSQVMIGFLVDICVNCTFSISFTVVTPSLDGRALATVGEFRWVDGFGKNLGCKAPDCGAYRPVLLQNTSSTPFKHESQNDTMTVDLFYISNIALTYLQRIPTEVQDNQLAFEVMVWVADHPIFTNGYTFNVDCGVKVNSVIYVASKPLTVSFTGTEKMVLLSSLALIPEPQGAFTANEEVSFTYIVQHVANESMVEVNSALVRILFPPYIKFVEGKNTYSANISNTSIAVKDYVDLSIEYLFFTDILELNFSLTVDPAGTMPKGLGLTNVTTLVRLVGIPGNVAGTPFKYCGPTAYVNYLVDSKDCDGDIIISGFDPCQFAASTAMDASTTPEKAFTTGWSPAVRSGGWEHHITIDFLRTARVTKLILQAPSPDYIPILSLHLLYSRNGFRFSPACEIEIPVENNEITIPAPCRDGVRYVRLVVHADQTDETKPISLIISAVKGCYISNETGVCDTSLETMKTVITNLAKNWRHIAFDATHSIFYFCDWVPLRGKMVCYCTPDNSQWTAIPSYIGEIIGYSAKEDKMCAHDTGGRALLCSSDCSKWGIIDVTTMAAVEADAKLIPAKVVPGTGDVEVSLNGYTADFTGVKFGGVYIVKWSSCCT